MRKSNKHLLLSLSDPPLIFSYLISNHINHINHINQSSWNSLAISAIYSLPKHKEDKVCLDHNYKIVNNHYRQPNYLSRGRKCVLPLRIAYAIPLCMSYT